MNYTINYYSKQGDEIILDNDNGHMIGFEFIDNSGDPYRIVVTRAPLEFENAFINVEAKQFIKNRAGEWKYDTKIERPADRAHFSVIATGLTPDDPYTRDDDGNAIALRPDVLPDFDYFFMLCGRNRPPMNICQLLITPFLKLKGLV